MIQREYIEEVKNRSSAVDIIGSYVSLKRAGSNYTACCPFHSEKTPSFTVYPNDNSFFCFGCGAGGSIITFIQRIENLDFTDAVRFLADRVGVRIPEDTDSFLYQKTVSRERLYELNLAAAKYFRNVLFSPAGAEGMAYIKGKRGLSEATIRRFGLGFAPAKGNDFVNQMKQLGFTDDELIQGFLAKPSTNKNSGTELRSMFWNRLMFPIFDTSGRIVAFGGRVMDDSVPKYLNSSDTPAFKKMKNLYALNYAKNNGSDTMILCEGYMDVIALHAAGFSNAVATLGTAITPDHARLLSRYVKKCILMYDSDDAGRRADAKAMNILGEVGIEVRVLKLQDAKDPDEFLKKFGKEKLAQALNETKSGFDYKLDSILKKYDLSYPEQKARASKEVCTMIADYHSSVEREIYTAQAYKLLDVSIQSMKETIAEIIKSRVKKSKQEEKQQAFEEVNRFTDRFHNTGSDSLRAIYTEETIIGLLLMYDDYRNLVAKGQIPLEEEDFLTDFGKQAFSEIIKLQKEEGGFDFSLLGQFFDNDQMGRLSMCLQNRKQLSNNSTEVLMESIQTLKKTKEEELEESIDPLEEIRKKQEAAKQAKNQQAQK